MTQSVTLKQVAAHAGVSFQTISKVINGKGAVSAETEERIWKAVTELGYHPDHTARSLRSRRTMTLGYSWFPSPADHLNPILDQFLQSMLRAAEEKGYYLLSFPHAINLQDQVKAYKKLIDARRVDGFVLSNVVLDDPCVAYLIERQFPFVAFGRSNPDWDFPYIDIDGTQGMMEVTQHLLQQGHRRIAILATPKNSRVGANRLEGCITAMRDAGIEPSPAWIAHGEGSYTYGLRIASQWLQSPPEERPTAIIALNDNMANGAIHAANELGIQVGAELAITGFDDAPFIQYLTPPLTSVRQPIWDVGQRVIRLLVSILENHPLEESHVLLPPKLIIRESSLGYKPS